MGIGAGELEGRSVVFCGVLWVSGSVSVPFSEDFVGLPVGRTVAKDGETDGCNVATADGFSGFRS